MKAKRILVDIPVYEHGGYNLRGERVLGKIIDTVQGYKRVCPLCGGELYRGVGDLWRCDKCEQKFEEPDK